MRHSNGPKPHIVVYSAGVLHYGGVENALLQLFQFLDGDYRFTLTGTAHPEFLERLAPLAIDYHPLPAPSAFSRGAARQLAELCKTLQADLIHTIDPRGSTVAGLAAWMAGLPIVHRNQISPLDYEGSRLARLFYHVGEAVLGWCFLDATIFVAERVRWRYVTRGLVPTWRSYYIPYGVEAAPLEALRQQHAALRQALDVPDGAFLWAFVARLAHQKAPEVVLEAAAQLRDLPNWYLLVGGDGPLEAALKASMQQHSLENQVRFLGALAPDQAHATIAAADALLLPSRYENMPITLLETLQLHVPALVTEVGDSWYMIGGGDLPPAGLKVRMEDATDLAQQMRRLMDDPALYAQLKAACVARAAQFTAESSLAQIKAVFDRCLESKKAT